MNKRIYIFLSVIMAVFIIFISIPYTFVKASIPSGVTSGYIYGQYGHKQKSCWCWVACAENACIAENHWNHDQYYAVLALMGSPSDPYPNVGGTIFDIVDAVTVISSGYLSYTNGPDVQYNYIAEKIYYSHPVIAGLTPLYSLQGNVGHAVLIIGWDNSLGSETIYYHDPDGLGSYHICSYSEFCNGYVNDLIYSSSAYYN